MQCHGVLCENKMATHTLGPDHALEQKFKAHFDLVQPAVTHIYT